MLNISMFSHMIQGYLWCFGSQSPCSCLIRSIPASSAKSFDCNRYFVLYFPDFLFFFSYFSIIINSLMLFLFARAVVALMDIDWQSSAIPSWISLHLCRCAFNRLCSFHRKHTSKHMFLHQISLSKHTNVGGQMITERMKESNRKEKKKTQRKLCSGIQRTI